LNSSLRHFNLGHPAERLMATLALAVLREDAAVSTAQGAPTLPKPVAPPAVENDSDGLSRDPEDCMKGCLDTTY
jgi:hypothetical protein